MPDQVKGWLIVIVIIYANMSMWDFGRGYEVPRWAVPGRILFFSIAVTVMGILIYGGTRP